MHHTNQTTPTRPTTSSSNAPRKSKKPKKRPITIVPIKLNYEYIRQEEELERQRLFQQLEQRQWNLELTANQKSL